jgi:hypothetical protein
MHSSEPTIPAGTVVTKFVVDAEALRAALDHLIKLAGSQVRAAEQLSISPQYLTDVIHSRRDIAALAERMGYAPLTVFIRASEPSISPALAARVIERLRRHRVDLTKGSAA